jgi:DNA-binding NarL/FixJ family response regulator
MESPTIQPIERSIRVALILENRLVREALVRLFRKVPDLCITKEYSPADAPISPDSAGDVIVVDDLQTAVELGSSLRSNGHVALPAAMLLIGMEDDEEQFLTAVRAGMTGYLLSSASAEDVIASVRALARGEAVCPPSLCMALFRVAARNGREGAACVKRGTIHGLTIRQQQLVSLVAKGLTNKEIASQLNLSEFTIKNHIHRIMKQVEAENRHEVVEVVRASGYDWPA